MPDSHDHDHDHDHDRDRGPAQGPLADASVRRAGVNDAPAVGYVQAEVWRAAYEGKVPAEVTSAFTPTAFGNAWRDSLATPPPGAHALFVALAGGQVVGFVAVGPSQDPDSDATTGEVTALQHAAQQWLGLPAECGAAAAIA